MILVDIGNSSLHFGIEKENRLIDAFRIYNKNINKKYLRHLLEKYPNQGIIICSVAPSIEDIFKKLKRKNMYVIGKDIKIPIKSFYSERQIGQDRLVNAFASKYSYPKAKIIVDFGTAITIDFLSEKGNYLGGMILPGINLYLESLRRCELLPDKIKLYKEYALIPKDTKSSISKGVREGFPLMINGIVRKYKSILSKKQKRRIEIIVTGGESLALKKRLEFKHIYDPFLTLKGLLLAKKMLMK